MFDAARTIVAAVQVGSISQEFAKVIRTESAHWRKPIKDIGLKLKD